MTGPFPQRSRTVLTVSVATLVGIHLIALIVFPEGLTITELVAVESSGGVVVMAALLVAGEDPVWGLTIGLAVFASAVGAWTLATTVADLWVAGSIVLAVGATASYITHRFELVTLGLLEETA